MRVNSEAVDAVVQSLLEQTSGKGAFSKAELGAISDRFEAFLTKQQASLPTAQQTGFFDEKTLMQAASGYLSEVGMSGNRQAVADIIETAVAADDFIQYDKQDKTDYPSYTQTTPALGTPGNTLQRGKPSGAGDLEAGGPQSGQSTDRKGTPAGNGNGTAEDFLAKLRGVGGNDGSKKPEGGGGSSSGGSSMQDALDSVRGNGGGRTNGSDGGNSGMNTDGKDKASDLQYKVGDSGDDTQKVVATNLSTLINNPDVVNLLKSKDPNNGQEITTNGIGYLARLDVNDKDDAKWGGITDKDERQSLQNAARLLLGQGSEEQKPIAEYFAGAMAKEGNAISLTEDEAKNFIKDPASIGKSSDRTKAYSGKGDNKGSEAKMGMEDHISRLLNSKEVMKVLVNDEGKVSDDMLNNIADAKMDDKVWGDVPQDQRQGLQDSARILLNSKRFKISDEEHKAIGAEFENKFGSFQDIDLKEFEKAGSNKVYDGVIDPDNIGQMSEGNCFNLSAIASFAQTEKGQKIIKDAIKDNGDGTWTVTLPGNKYAPAIVTKQDLEANFNTGDGDAEILNSAIEKIMGRTVGDGGFAYDVWQILGGADSEIGSKKGTADELKSYLIENAGRIDKDLTLAFGAKPIEEHRADISGGGHQFYVSEVNVESGTVTYRNPWDTSKEHTMSIDDFAKAFADINKGIEFMEL